jgi:hypothetical protein
MPSPNTFIHCRLRIGGTRDAGIEHSPENAEIHHAGSLNGGPFFYIPHIYYGDFGLRKPGQQRAGTSLYITTFAKRRYLLNGGHDVRTLPACDGGFM